MIQNTNFFRSRKMLFVFRKTELKKFIVDGVFEGECYIKIIDDWDEFGSEYYYYVSVIGRRGSSISVVISPKSCEFLASNCNVL